MWLEGTAPDPQSTTLAVCRTSGCVLETNIPTLPDGLRRTCSNPGCMLEVEIQNRDFLGGGAVARYVDRAPSRAVDDRAETYFESYHGELCMRSGRDRPRFALTPYLRWWTDARAGEYVLLDQLAAGRSRRASGGRMVLLIDRSTARILAASALEASCDRTNWVSVGGRGGFLHQCADCGCRSCPSNTRVSVARQRTGSLERPALSRRICWSACWSGLRCWTLPRRKRLMWAVSCGCGCWRTWRVGGEYSKCT